MAVTIARGLQTVGASPALLVSAFLATLLLWLGFVAFGTAPSPSAMVLMTALPPIHSLLIDVGAVLTGTGRTEGAAAILLAGLLIVRAAVLSFWVSASLERLERLDRSTEGPGGWREAAGRILRRTTRAMGPMIGVEAGFYVLAMAIAVIAVGFAIGQFAVIAGLIGGVYFLVYAPIVVVTERLGLREAARVAVRAARLPGPRHMMATIAYIAVVLVVSLFAPASRVAAVTPTITLWLYVLMVSFLHVAAVATFTYRWLLIRDQVLEPPARGADRAEEPSPEPAR